MIGSVGFDRAPHGECRTSEEAESDQSSEEPTLAIRHDNSVTGTATLSNQLAFWGEERHHGSTMTKELRTAYATILLLT